MDPFLEHPAIFPGVHDGFIAYLREALQARLPEPYYAEIGSRIWVEVSQRPIQPDANVLKQRDVPEREMSAGQATATVPRTQPVVVTVPFDEARETYLEIFTRDDREQLVTSIEVLSFSNKTPGERGRELYLQKQRELLESKVHLVEIDLLRGGLHTTAVPKNRAVEKTGAFDYHVCIHRFDRIEDFLVYPIKMNERLPEIAIPLLPADPPVPIDLQAVFDRCYDTGPYRRRVRYEDGAVPPLLPQQAAWAAEVLMKRDA
jgi:hypothetical protein